MGVTLEGRWGGASVSEMLAAASAKEAGWAAARCLRQELVAILKLAKVEVLEKIQVVA